MQEESIAVVLDLLAKFKHLVVKAHVLHAQLELLQMQMILLVIHVQQELIVQLELIAAQHELPVKSVLLELQFVQLELHLQSKMDLKLHV